MENKECFKPPTRCICSCQPAFSFNNRAISWKHGSMVHDHDHDHHHRHHHRRRRHHHHHHHGSFRTLPSGTQTINDQWLIPWRSLKHGDILSHWHPSGEDINLQAVALFLKKRLPVSKNSRKQLRGHHRKCPGTTESKNWTTLVSWRSTWRNPCFISRPQKWHAG